MANEITLVKLNTKGFLSDTSFAAINSLTAQYKAAKAVWKEQKNALNAMKHYVRIKDCFTMANILRDIHGIRKDMITLRTRIRDMVTPAVRNFACAELDIPADEEYVPGQTAQAPAGMNQEVVNQIKMLLDARPEIREFLKTLLQ